jgi:hypothetical protein
MDRIWPELATIMNQDGASSLECPVARRAVP